MSLTPASVLAALSHVEEPDLKKDLVTLGMVRDVKVEGSRVAFTVVLTTPACPLKDLIRNACINAVQHFCGKDLQVDVHLTANVTTATPTQAGGTLPGVKNMIAVASGKGGVGKSTVAANLAIALAQSGSRVGLLDADVYGPSIPLMFGLEDAQPDVHEAGLNAQGQPHLQLVPLQAHGIQLMSIGFLISKNESIVWRGPRISSALRQMIVDTLWQDLDYLIVDLPPGTGDIHITLAQQFPLSGAVVVTTPEAVALTDVRKAIGMFLAPAINVPVLGVVENMAYFAPPELPGKKYFLFGEGGGAALAAEFGVPLLGQLPILPAIQAGSDAGTPAALQAESPEGLAFAQLAAAVAQQISIRNAHLTPVMS